MNDGSSEPRNGGGMQFSFNSVAIPDEIPPFDSSAVAILGEILSDAGRVVWSATVGMRRPFVVPLGHLRTVADGILCSGDKTTTPISFCQAGYASCKRLWDYGKVVQFVRMVIFHLNHTNNNPVCSCILRYLLS